MASVEPCGFCASARSRISRIGESYDWVADKLADDTRRELGSNVLQVEEQHR
jgi:hypothetical protein